MHNDRAGLVLANARTGAGRPLSVRVVGSRIAAVNADPQPGDTHIDLRGARLLPGLINAHDHLQLNALPRLKYRELYGNAAEWIDDIRPRLESDPMFVANRAVERADRLLIGGIKNLLSGATTVAHHDPLYPGLAEDAFPIRVIASYGWSHSLSLDGAEQVRRAHRETPADWPWIIHAAEGTDVAAAAEFDRLESLGCITTNTLIVHGLALTPGQQVRLDAAGAGLIWCPSSNLHLFGRTLDVEALSTRGLVALGSDSRLSGARDLLAELRVARVCSGFDEARLEALVTERAAKLLRQTDRGRLEPGMLADLLALPAGVRLFEATRADVQLVMVGGRVRYADPEYAETVGDRMVEVRVDGTKKCLLESLVARLRKAKVHEPGLTLSPAGAVFRAGVTHSLREEFPINCG